MTPGLLGPLVTVSVSLSSETTVSSLLLPMVEPLVLSLPTDPKNKPVLHFLDKIVHCMVLNVSPMQLAMITTSVPKTCV